MPLFRQAKIYYSGVIHIIVILSSEKHQKLFLLTPLCITKSDDCVGTLPVLMFIHIIGDSSLKGDRWPLQPTDNFSTSTPKPAGEV